MCGLSAKPLLPAARSLSHNLALRVVTLLLAATTTIYTFIHTASGKIDVLSND
jgi:hypothetical protein